MERHPLLFALPEFVLLTGALGSGKTTLLSDHLSLNETSDTGVIINDAGEVNVDGAIIRSDHRDLALATLSDGCICCSLGNSLQEGIDALLLARAERRLGPLRRIILETSGLAEPGPIVRSLRQVREMDFHLRIVATFDAARSTQGDDFLPHYAAQLAAAQTIVLTKLDTLPPEEWQARANEARRFNPLAAGVVSSRREERARAAFAATTGGKLPRVSEFRASEPSPSRITIVFVHWSPAASWEAIGEWIENVSGCLGPRLLRLKGFVRPSGFGDPLLIDGVGGAFSPPRRVRAEDEASLGLMMILRDVAREDLFGVSGSASNPELRFK
jgi:G3E family GTPase